MNFHRLPAWLLFGLVLIAVVILATPGASYSHQDRDQPLAIASVRHPAGTDALGRDR